MLRPLLLLCAVLPACSRQPHVLLIIADDYGFHDVGYHGSEIRTPTLDSLARGGIRLENYYVQPICTPSRSQLLSGRYQIHTGLQHGIIWPAQRNGLPLEDATIADQLKAVGYSTHMVGKWHIGFYKKEYTPTYRGFDSFFGYLTGSEDYYSHKTCGSVKSSPPGDGQCVVPSLDTGKVTFPPAAPDKNVCGLDFRQDDLVVWNNTEYSTTLFAKKAIDVIKNHDNSKPLFLYMPFQAVHAPLEVPKEYYNMYPNIRDHKRRTYAGMVTCMDEAIKNVTNAFKAAGLWNDTVLIFSTDNGGQILEGGSNYPLRGWKGSLWEGGVHGVGFVHSAFIPKPGTVNNELIHISDWYPTLLHLAGSNASTDHLDGYNQWETISNNQLGPRKELLHNIDPLYGKKGDPLFPGIFNTQTRAALRAGDWKIITGDPCNGSWIPAPGDASAPGITHDTSKVTQNLWLFNIKEDPNERNDLSKQRPDKVKFLLERLNAYNITAVPPRYPKNDPNCDPALHGGAWGPWM